MDKTVQTQFGANAASYASSPVHAKGASLARLVELVAPQPDWQVLDVATAAGHTAFAFAPHVEWVTAVDITPEMLTVAVEEAAKRKIENITLQLGNAEALPFEDDIFHLVTCRIAPHHFNDIDQFLREAARVLRPNGMLAIVDNVVPGSYRRGKKARRQRQSAAARAAGEYVNAFEKLRDPSHHRCLAVWEWETAVKQANFAVISTETIPKTMNFHRWAARMNVSPADTIRLQAMLLQSPAPVAAFLTPQVSSDRIEFFLTEAILISRKIEGRDRG